METAFHTHVADIELNLVGKDWWESCISHHQGPQRTSQGSAEAEKQYVRIFQFRGGWKHYLVVCAM